MAKVSDYLTVGKAEWMADTDEMENLIHATPSRNIDQAQATGFVQKVIDDFDSLRSHLDEYAGQRGDEILEAHRRVREATRLTGVKHEIEPQLPVGVLGIDVYLPA